MWLTALKASWRQNFIMATRYLFNMLSGIITMYIVFLLMFYGVRAVGAGAFDLGSTLEGLFTGYIIWMIVIMGYQEALRTMYPMRPRQGHWSSCT